MIGYSYDANGNQVSTPDGATLTYDADNRMTGWSRSGASESYQYHPGGTRVWKSRNFTSDTFGIFYLHGPSGQLLAERDTAGVKDYVYFAGRLLYSPAGTVYRDRLGSARVTGTPTSGYTTRNYYPFGEEIGSTTAGNQYKFADTYRDSTSGLDYALNRYYPSTMGRFLSVDLGGTKPSNPQRWNRYAYVLNDPVNLTDPTGLEPEGIPVLRCSFNGSVYFGLLCELLPRTFLPPPPPPNPETVVGEVYSARLQAFQRLNNQLRAQTADAIRNLDPRCKDAIGAVTSLSKVAATSAETVYYDARVYGSELVRTISGYPRDPPPTLTEYIGAGAAAVLLGPNEEILNMIGLAAAFFDQLTPDQNVTLVHEALHTTTGRNDTQLASRLGFGDITDPVAASVAIRNWLKYGCAPVK